MLVDGNHRFKKKLYSKSSWFEIDDKNFSLNPLATDDFSRHFLLLLYRRWSSFCGFSGYSSIYFQVIYSLVSESFECLRCLRDAKFVNIIVKNDIFPTRHYDHSLGSLARWLISNLRGILAKKFKIKSTCKNVYFSVKKIL